MGEKPLQYRSRLSVRDGGTHLGADAFEKTEDSIATPEAFIDAFALALPSCAGCLSVMHSPEEVGGACSVCRELVCKNTCSERRCQIDGKVVCLDHSVEVRGRIACRTHRFLDLVLLALRRAEPNRS